MSTLSDIITRAYRQLNLIAVGASPSAAQETEALELLQRSISSYFGSSLGTEFADITVGKQNVEYEVKDNFEWLYYLKDYIAIPNTRLLLNLTASEELWMHSAPLDGDRLAIVDAAGNLNTNNLTLYGNGRKIEGGTSVTLNTANETKEWFYRADLGDWVAVTDLTTTDPSPFPKEFDELLIGDLAISLCPLYGTAMTAEQMTKYQKALSRFRTRYNKSREMPLDPALVKTSTFRTRFV